MYVVMYTNGKQEQRMNPAKLFQKQCHDTELAFDELVVAGFARLKQPEPHVL